MKALRTSMQAATRHAAAMLDALAIKGDDQTPARFVRALVELTQGLDDDPRKHLEVQFPAAGARAGLVIVRDVEWVSICEHHLLPVVGTATVAYLPHDGERIVGLSKLARLVQGYAARPQVQERIADQVLTALDEVLKPAGSAVKLTGSHSCMSLRGARAGLGASMVTTRYCGALETEPWLSEFRGN